MGSDRLKRILEHLLAIGNAMNVGARSSIANAKGFTLDSLLKLAETRATSRHHRKTTLLQFFVGMVVERGEGDLLLFPRELLAGDLLADVARLSDVRQLARPPRLFVLALPCCLVFLRCSCVPRRASFARRGTNERTDGRKDRS